MNKHLSVLGLWARQTMGKILALLAVMAAAETALFAWALSQGLTRDIMDNQTCPAPVEDLFDFARISWVYRIAVILLFVLLILRGYWIAMHARDRFGALMVGGLTTLLALQVFFNIGVVTNFLPATGISLPFFSYGGTALLLQLFEMGLILSVSRQSNNQLLM